MSDALKQKEPCVQLRHTEKGIVVNYPMIDGNYCIGRDISEIKHSFEM